MKKISLKGAALVIVTASSPGTGVSSTDSRIDTAAQNYSKIAFDDSAITRNTCQQLYIRDNDYPIVPDRAEDSDRLYKAKSSIKYDGYPDHIVDLADTLNEADFKEGHLTITDCVGSAITTDVRLREFSLDEIFRQGTEPAGWKFSTEATNRERKLLRVTQLELPPANVWRVNSDGTGLIAEELLFHINNNNDANVGYYRRVRITEVLRIDDEALLIKQRFSINHRFSELQTWTLAYDESH